MNISQKEQSPASIVCRVTVAIPTFNRLDLLKRSISSVLAQRYADLEIIVSDNASSDGTVEYLQSLHDPRIKLLLNSENLGMVANWDRCLQAASGTYFVLMSDDDALLGEHALEKFVDGFSGAGNIGLVFSDVQLERSGRDSFDVTATRTTRYAAAELIEEFYSNKVSVFPCATCVRTADLLDLGGYASFGALLAVDACAWMSIALKYGTVARVPEPLAIYRVHQSLSSSSVEVWSADFKVMLAVLTAHQKQMTQQEFQGIEKAMTAAWNRVPLGYVVRRFKYDANYGAVSAIRDAISWWPRFFALSNIEFVLKKFHLANKR